MTAVVSPVDTATRRAHRVGLLWVIGGTLLGVAVFVWIAGMGRTQAAVPGPSPAPVVLVERSDNLGQVLFGRYCDSCHPGGRAGIGSDLEGIQVKRQYTSEDRIVKYVRAGGFDMPAFPPSLLADDDLAAIAVYARNLPAQAR